MAGSKSPYRHLSRSSAHRRALLRNMVTSLIEHESIATTWHKAKEAQRMAEKMISHGKKNTNASRNQAKAFLFQPKDEAGEPVGVMGKLFGQLRARYQDRPGGYTRVLRIEPLKEDQAPSAILELVDGPKDMRFALTARTIANLRERDHAINDMTAANIRKVTKYRKDGEKELGDLVQKFENLSAADREYGVPEEQQEKLVKKKKVYPALERSR